MSIEVAAMFPNIASIVVSSEHDIDKDLKFIRISNALDDSFVNIDPSIDLCELLDAIAEVAYANR